MAEPSFQVFLFEKYLPWLYLWIILMIIADVIIKNDDITKFQTYENFLVWHENNPKTMENV